MLVVSRLQLVLIVEPISEGARRSLGALLQPADGDLRALAFPAGGDVGRLLRRREALRDRVGQELRVMLPSLVGASQPERALRRALSDERVDVSRLGTPPTRTLPTPASSLVPRLGEVAEMVGIRLVVVRPPRSPLATGNQADRVDRGVPEQTQSILERYGAEYLDLYRLPMGRKHYRNVDHLGEEGAKRFTHAVLRYLTARPPTVDALGQPQFVDGSLVLQRGELRYTTPPPALDMVEPWEPGARPGVRWVSAPRSVPPDTWTMAHTPAGTRCSPLRVQMRDQLLTGGRPCKRLRPGTSCHGHERVGWIPPFGQREGERLILDPARSCEGAAWLYPGDRLVLRWPEHPTEGGRQAVIQAVARRPHARVQAVLQQGSRRVRGTLVSNEPWVVALEGAEPPTLEVHSDSYALLTRAELVSR